MNENSASAETSPASLLAGLPRWARIALPAIFLAECAVLAAGLARDQDGAKGTVRIDLPSSRPAPGFSSL